MVLSLRLCWSHWLLEEREQERDFRFCIILFTSPWCAKLCEHGLRPCNAHRASLVRLERCVKPFQTQDGWHGFGSGWMERRARSMALHGQARRKPRQIVEQLLPAWGKLDFLRESTSRHACCKALEKGVAQISAARSHALPALLYLMQKFFVRCKNRS